MRRETQHVLLVLLGGVLLRIAADDTYLRYVRPSHRWLLVLAGVVIVGLGAVALVCDLRARDPGDGAEDSADEHGHAHGSGGSVVPWLLFVPVLVIALVAPPALGADAVDRAGSRNAAVQYASLFGPLPEGPAPELSLAEFVERAAWDTSGSLDGREVTLTGFVVRRGAYSELARLTVGCCAADARANRVRMVGDFGVTAPEPDVWLRVRGTLVPGSSTAESGYVPVLEVRAFDVVEAPPDPYEY